MRNWKKWHWLSWPNNTRLDSVNGVVFGLACWGMMKFTVSTSELWSRTLAEKNRQFVFFGTLPWSIYIRHSFLDIFTLVVKYVHHICLVALYILTPVILIWSGNRKHDFLVQIISTRKCQIFLVNHKAPVCQCWDKGSHWEESFGFDGMLGDGGHSVSRM